MGDRPQFTKAAAVSREIAKYPEIDECIIHTGQHYDDNMSAVFFREMQISAPDYHLTINTLNHGAMTGRMLEKIEGILDKEKPDFVLVYGDTNSTLAGALAAKKLHLKILHVEAGLELLRHTKIVLTDSGGLQKEAFFFKKPCVTLRDETEWTELVEHGYNMTAGTKEESIYACYTAMKELNVPFDIDLYGDGNASRHIVKAMIGNS